MAEEVDALSGAKFGSGLFLTDFPVKIRVLTLDPLVHTDNYANTRYAFVVLNLDENRVQVLDKGPGFAQEFQRIHADPDFGGNVRNIDIKITTNGKSGKETRYFFNPIGTPSELTQEQLQTIKAANIDLDAVIRKGSPNAVRLSEINKGAKLPSNSVEPSNTQDDVVIEDIGDEPINLDDIPF